VLVVEPFWLEVAVVSVIGAGVILSYVWWCLRAIIFPFKAAYRRGEGEVWALAHWRQILKSDIASSLGVAPFLEEVFFRGPAVLLLQAGHWKWAIAGGLMLNVVFALIHRGMFMGPAADPWVHRQKAAIFGGIFLFVGLLSGLLIVAVLFHAYINFLSHRARGHFVLYRREQLPVGATVYMVVHKQRYEIEIPGGHNDGDTATPADR
jgi:hypothetical protein